MNSTAIAPSMATRRVRPVTGPYPCREAMAANPPSPWIQAGAAEVSDILSSCLGRPAGVDPAASGPSRGFEHLPPVRVDRVAGLLPREVPVALRRAQRAGPGPGLAGPWRGRTSQS